MPHCEAEPIAYVNGEFVPQSQARISVLDHAVLYGDGIFETACARERPHLQARCAHRSRLPLDGGDRARAAVDRAAMRALIVETVRRNGFADAYIKWIVTRGSNGRPLMDPAGCVAESDHSRAALHQSRIRGAIAQGLRLKTVAVRRPPGQVLDPQIKSINYLNLVLAKLEAKAAGADEALLLDLKAGFARRPAATSSSFAGGGCDAAPRHPGKASRARRCSSWRRLADWRPRPADLELYDAYTADEILSASTAGGMLPVREIDGRPIGNGRPGPVFRALHDAYAALVSFGTVRHAGPLSRCARARSNVDGVNAMRIDRGQ